MGNYNDEKILGSSMSKIRQLAMVPVAYGVFSVMMNFIPNTGAAHAQDCSKIEDFTKKLACEIEKETKELKDAKTDLADAKDEGFELDKKIIVVKAEANAVIEAIKDLEKTYDSTKKSLNTAVEVVTDVVKTVSDTVEN